MPACVVLEGTILCILQFSLLGKTLQMGDNMHKVFFRYVLLIHLGLYTH